VTKTTKKRSRAATTKRLPKTTSGNQVFKIEWTPIDSVIPYYANPRSRSQVAVDKVAASLKEFGWRQPIVVDANRVIVVGHTRWFAAKKLRLVRVPIHVAKDLTAEQVRAYRIADNRTNEETEWDENLLGMELQDLSDLDYNLELTAFETEELEQLLGIGGGGGDDNTGALAPPPMSWAMSSTRWS
jgi:ParB-like chromosome segregation protein Spo0J